MDFGFSMRGQYPAGTDMQESFAKACELARVADGLGYSYLTKGQHYSSTPLQALQQFAFLARIMAEAPMRSSSPASCCCRCTSRSMSSSNWRQST